MVIRYSIIFALILHISHSAPLSDEITSLPGWNGNFPSKQYSGYLNITETKHYHYWFVECENDPENAPTVLWLNGGPGCSSLDGLLRENGPFRIDTSTNPPSLYYFEYNWAKLANMIFLESPVGVGFSYSDNEGDYQCTDDTTAADNLLSMEKFFDLFPEYANNPFYITGESYAGIYIPTLAEAILQKTLDGNYKGAPLKGIAVGNGCTGTEVGICGDRRNTFQAQFFSQTTGFLSPAVKKNLDKSCNWETPYDVSLECEKAMHEMSQSLYLINTYNVYGECADGTKGGWDESVQRDFSKAGPSRVKSGKSGPSWCIDNTAAFHYLNQDEVMEAIHVRKPDFKWRICGTVQGWTYDETRPNLPRDTYPFLEEHIRSIIYNGDWDACVPYTDNQAWTRDMGYDINEDWHQWFYKLPGSNEEQVGGYATRYESKNNFTFMTIRGGRHEVPETAPEASYEMLRRLISGEEF